MTGSATTTTTNDVNNVMLEDDQVQNNDVFDSVPRFELQHTLLGHQRSVAAVRFSPDGCWLATACTFS